MVDDVPEAKAPRKKAAKKRAAKKTAPRKRASKKKPAKKKAAKKTEAVAKTKKEPSPRSEPSSCLHPRGDRQVFGYGATCGRCGRLVR